MPTMDLISRQLFLVTSLISGRKRLLYTVFVGILTLSLLVDSLSTGINDPRAECNVQAIWNQCTSRFDNASPSDKGEYLLGWKPYTEVRDMCRKRMHVKALQCLYQELTSQCTDKRVYIYVYKMFDYKMYEYAANYMCEKHNIEIFEENIACLKKYQDESLRCEELAPVKGTLQSAVLEVQKTIDNNSATTKEIRTNPEAMVQFIEKTIDQHLCTDRKIMISCIERLLLEDTRTCPYAITKLMVNYYSHILPINCKYNSRSTYTPVKDPVPALEVPKQQSPSSYSYNSRNEFKTGSRGVGKMSLVVSCLLLFVWR